MAGPNSLYPSFIQIHYHSGWGKHVQTIPTRQWSPGIGGSPYGGYTNWGSAARTADDMVNDLIDKLAIIADNQTAWDNAIVFNYPTPLPSDPQPVAIIPLTQVGAVAHTDNAIAYQNLYTFFDSAFNTFKFVTLDMDFSLNMFPKGYGDLNSAHQDVVNALTDGINAWASRANSQPTTLRSVISKYNDKLRKEYNLT